MLDESRAGTGIHEHLGDEYGGVVRLRVVFLVLKSVVGDKGVI